MSFFTSNKIETTVLLRFLSLIQTFINLNSYSFKMNNNKISTDYLNKLPRNVGNIELELRPFYHTDIKNLSKILNLLKNKIAEKAYLKKCFLIKVKH